MKLGRLAGLLLCVPLAACTAGAGPSSTATDAPIPPATVAASPSGIVLRRAPADLACDSIGIDYTSLQFRIDPEAAEQVAAVTDTGVELKTYWADGFQPGTAAERVVRDPAGQVVATDGEVLGVPNTGLHGYFVCLGQGALWVLRTDPGEGG